MIQLYEHQLNALRRIHNGCIVCGGVGSGKSITSLSWYYLKNGGTVGSLKGGAFVKMRNPKDIYIITTAKKRDSREWEAEMRPFGLSIKEKENAYSNVVVIDSWNNIEKYMHVNNACFIFDEQHVVGYGSWSKAFIEIAKHNDWILLSATPADDWPDYMSVFIANGFYRNKSDFVHQHIVYKPFRNFPQIDRFVDVERLIRLRERVLVTMEFERKTERHIIDKQCSYDIDIYKFIQKERCDPETGEPYQNVSSYCQALRKVINADPSRIRNVLALAHEKKRVIVFYNYNYERDILKEAPWPNGFEIAEWNSHAHQPIPESERWAYLVQYNAGAEGWNCIRTDTIIFYSQTYSYKQLEQAMGRIDRLNTPYEDLWYFTLICRAPVDQAIRRALKAKKRFNEGKFAQNFIRKD